jgi:hypothetical protein
MQTALYLCQGENTRILEEKKMGAGDLTARAHFFEKEGC